MTTTTTTTKKEVQNDIWREKMAEHRSKAATNRTEVKIHRKASMTKKMQPIKRREIPQSIRISESEMRSYEKFEDQNENKTIIHAAKRGCSNSKVEFRSRWLSLAFTFGRGAQFLTTRWPFYPSIAYFFFPTARHVTIQRKLDTSTCNFQNVGLDLI